MMEGGERIILHLDMNAFFASVEQRDQPWLRGQPVFVCGNRHSRTVVATASYDARAFGVKTGMPIQEALARCPLAILVEGHPAKYADAFRQVAHMMERYSPELEVMSIDEAFLDLTMTVDRFGGALAIAAELQREVKAHLGLSCSIGLGPNKLIAKLASSRKKPNGITHIRSQDVDAVLAELPIGELCGIGQAFQAALHAQGIATCGKLAQLTSTQLIAQFGVCAGLQLSRLARGCDESPVVPTYVTPPARSMGHLHTLAHNTDEVTVLRGILLDLSEKVGRRLRAERAAGRTVTLTLHYGDFTTFSRARTLSHAVDDGAEIYAVGCRLLSTAAPAHSVRMIGICVSGLSYGMRQRWWLPERIRQEQLLGARDRINDRFGEATISRATLLGTPEARQHYQIKRYTARTMRPDGVTRVGDVHGSCRCATPQPSSACDYRASSAGGHGDPRSASPVNVTVVRGCTRGFPDDKSHALG